MSVICDICIIWNIDNSYSYHSHEIQSAETKQVINKFGRFFGVKSPSRPVNRLYDPDIIITEQTFEKTHIFAQLLVVYMHRRILNV